MKICVLQPSYEGSTFDYQYYDPPRDLSSLLPEHTVCHAFLKKVSTFRQLRDLKKRGFDIYVNLCEGYLDSDIPSIDVIMALEHLNMPYTGPTLTLYDPPKDLMKLVAHVQGVTVPAYVVAETIEGVAEAGQQLPFPLFVKPNTAGDSLGIDHDSLVDDTAALLRKASALIEAYGAVLIETYIAGREFTVLVYADPDPRCPPHALLPLEFRFPDGEHFKTYDLKVRQFHPECNVPCTDPVLIQRLQEAAVHIFQGFYGEGYARLDFRLSPANELYFLEVNFACSVFYPEGYQGSADYILAYDGLGQAGFLRQIIAEGLARHARKQAPYAVHRASHGYGLFATRPIKPGEVVWRGEERPHTLVTRSHVERTWPPAERAVFDRYAYPLGRDVYVMWDKDPATWAPQNHSCAPNTAFVGLNVVALRGIAADEELTIDYATFCDARMTPFDCQCGSPQCRGRIVGIDPMPGHRL
jgi:D-alanine-D-alanine ligase-like ATP-grasp enzyme